MRRWASSRGRGRCSTHFDQRAAQGVPMRVARPVRQVNGDLLRLYAEFPGQQRTLRVTEPSLSVHRPVCI